MFKCRECGSNEFKLLINPNFDGKVDVYTNEHEDVMINANGETFVADLMFMNNYAVCKGCGAKKQWEYYYPSKSPSEKT